jgi:hypothetical protein
MNCPESFSSNTSAATSGRSAPDTFCFGGLWRWDSLRSPASWRAAPTAPPVLLLVTPSATQPSSSVLSGLTSTIGLGLQFA